MNYIIKINCTDKKKLCCNNDKISNKNYNKLNLEQLINNTNYIKNVFLLFKKLKGKNFTTKTLEFCCKCDYEITKIDFQTFIKDMINIGFFSEDNAVVHLIKINKNKPNETIFTYKFQSITEIIIKTSKNKPNKSTYCTQFLYTK